MYTITLTRSEISALEILRGRYSWPDVLWQAVDRDTGVASLAEHEMSQWADDVAADQEGGHSAFPCASAAFADKLQSFLDNVV